MRYALFVATQKGDLTPKEEENWRSFSGTAESIVSSVPGGAALNQGTYQLPLDPGLLPLASLVRCGK